MNFNISKQPEYDLNSNLAHEMINLYGVNTKFLIMERMNEENIFGGYSHLKTDSNKIFEMYMLPENTEDWDEQDYGFSQFGFVNSETTNLFVSVKSFNNIVENNNPSKIIGNLLVFPNNKIMEITNVNSTVPGVNNLFTYNDAKTIYKLTCVPYNNKIINELDSMDISSQTDENDEPVDYTTLDNYFNELTNEQDNITNDIETSNTVQTVQDTTIVNKPVLNNNDDIFGKF